MNEPIRILCVDDEVNILRSFERLFLDEEYEILSALSADEGMARLEVETGIQVVLSDYRMPGRNGVEFLREVKRRRPETVRIVVSGYADTAAVVAAINEGGIYKFIPKPWNDDELKVTIQNALEKYFLEKQNAELIEDLRIANENLSKLVETLESKVAERTGRLTLQNQALRIAQNILDVLPFAVLGFDLEGTLVQLNQAGFELFRETIPFPLGRKTSQLLPPEVGALITSLPAASCIGSKVQMNGREYLAWITHLKESDQEGSVLVLQGAETLFQQRRTNYERTKSRSQTAAAANPLRR